MKLMIPDLVDVLDAFANGQEDLLRYVIRSGEVQRKLGELVSYIQDLESDCVYFGEGDLKHFKAQLLVVLTTVEILAKEGELCGVQSSYVPAER
jgi:hypothetical protein